MQEYDPNNPYRQALAANRTHQRRSDSNVGVALVVVGLMVLGLLVFAFVGDSGVAPASLTETATGGAAVTETAPAAPAATEGTAPAVTE